MRRCTVQVSIATLVVVGVLFAHLVEGFAWLDGFYFVAVTLGHVGYLNRRTATDRDRVTESIVVRRTERRRFHAVSAPVFQ